MSAKKDGDDASKKMVIEREYFDNVLDSSKEKK